MGNIVNRVFESAGPDGKVRGTPQQIIDKYQALARDAQVAGDRVAAENYLQHSEHYSRLLGEAQRQQNEQRFGQDRDDAPRGEEQPSEQRGGQPSGGGGAPREHQGGGPREQRPRPVPGFGLQTFEPEEENEFGPIPTPENGDAQPRLTAPAAEYQPAETLPEDPRDTAFDPRGAEAEPAAEAAPELVAEPAPPAAPAAPAPAEAAPEAAPTPAEPVAEAAPAPAKRPRTRRKKAEPAPEAKAEEAPKPDSAGDAPAEAQPVEPM